MECPDPCTVSAQECLACDARRSLSAVDLARLASDSAEGKNLRLASLLSVAPVLYRFHGLAARGKSGGQGLEDKTKVCTSY